jgi:hypothetical protein
LRHQRGRVEEPHADERFRRLNPVVVRHGQERRGVVKTKRKRFVLRAEAELATTTCEESQSSNQAKKPG